MKKKPQQRFNLIFRILIAVITALSAVNLSANNDFTNQNCTKLPHIKNPGISDISLVSDIVIVDQPREITVMEDSTIEIFLTLEGDLSQATFQWYKNYDPIDYTENPLIIPHASPTDIGNYYCKITDQGKEINSMWIKVNVIIERKDFDTTNLCAYYSFSGHFEDSTKNTGPAIATNVDFISGLEYEENEAIICKGNNSFVEIPDNDSLNVTSPFSILLTMCVMEEPSGTIPILRKGGSDSDTVGNYSLYLDSGLHPVFCMRSTNDSIYKLVSDYALTYEFWQLITLSFDGKEMKLQVNGLEPDSLEAPDLIPEINNNPIVIGNKEDTGIAYGIEEFRLYKRIIDEDEIYNFLSHYLPDQIISSTNKKVCVGDEVFLNAYFYGPFLSVSFYKDDLLLKKGCQGWMKYTIQSEEDFGAFTCIVSCGEFEYTFDITVSLRKIYDDLYFYDIPDKKIFASTGEDVQIVFNASNWIDGFEYEMYHNGQLLTTNNRNILNIRNVQPVHGGEYYFVIVNGCERVVSDTIELILEGYEFVTYEVEGWDWTSTIYGTGNSYFTNVCYSSDSSFYLLGYFGGGLRIEEKQVFSSGSDDVFIVKYNKQGDYLWSRFFSSATFKGRSDLGVDRSGNVYVCGSFMDTILIDNEKLSSDGYISGFIAKFTPEGKKIWNKKLESSYTLECSNIEIDGNNRIYLGGNFQESLIIEDTEINYSGNRETNNMYIASLDTAGVLQWVNHAVTDAHMMLGFGLREMILTKTGDIIAGGTLCNDSDFGNGIVLESGFENPFLVSYSPQGRAKWGTIATSELGFAETFNLSVDNSDNIFMTGMYLCDMTIGDFTVQYDDNLMEEIFLAKFNSSGECQSLRSFGSRGDGADFGLCYEPVNDTSGYLLGVHGDTIDMGEYSLISKAETGYGGSANMFLAWISESGNTLSLTSAGVRGYKFESEIHVSDDGRIFYAGLNLLASSKKDATEGGQSIAFAAFSKLGFEIPQAINIVRINCDSSICIGEGMDFRGTWLNAPGQYTDTVHSLEADTVYILNLSTEICSFNSDNYLNNSYRIYPNPADENIFIISEDQKEFELWIFNIRGQQIAYEEKNSIFEINTTHYLPGLYILKLVRNGTVSIHKVLIE